MFVTKSYDQLTQEWTAKAIENGFERGFEKGFQMGETAVFGRLVARAIGRPLSERELTRLTRRVEKRGSARLEDAIVAGDTKTLSRWIAAPPAKKR